MKIPTPWAPVSVAWQHRSLVAQLTRREVTGRYKGSFLGMTWVLLLPLIMLSVYTFVFSVVFQARWGVGETNRFQFAVILFCGLIVYNLFSECAMRAPSLVLNNPAYVKKVVFPLEILAWVSVCTALFYATASVGILLIFQLIAAGTIPATAILFPLIFLPLIFFTLGISWLLASLGVFVRDVGTLVGVLVTILMFVTPVFYPISSVPEKFRTFLAINPMTFVIEQSRAVMLWGQPINWMTYCLYLIASLAIAWLGLAWFQSTRKGFADVV